jgi:DNA-binding response OmpR family regulator
MKILVAEDMTTARLILDMTLKKLGHDVVATSDGEEAWQAFRQSAFPLVITDWQMPKVEGPELCRRIRAQATAKYTYILMLTSLDSKPEYMAAIDAGADDFLIKPFDEDILAARLRVAERIGGLLSEMQQLQGLLPICPTCKKIRDEQDQWTRLEDYVTTRLQAAVTPSRCPQCQAARSESDRTLRSKLEHVRRDFRKTPQGPSAPDRGSD